MTGPGGTPSPQDGPRLRGALRPRLRRVDLAIGALLLLLGFGVAVQVRSTQAEAGLDTARPADLVQILDELSTRGDRLRSEISTLNDTQARLSSGVGADQAALAEAKDRSILLGVLAGTLPARGPGITLTVKDPEGKVSASLLLETLEELRDAGAEAVQLSGRTASGTQVSARLVASSALEDAETGVTVDKTAVEPPFVFTALGDAATLDGAMKIPGGVTDQVQRASGTATVVQERSVVVSAVHATPAPKYAVPQVTPSR